MILFIHEDNAYRHWVTHHREGFVLDGTRKPKLGHLVLHRSTCPEIKAAASRGHATTGRRFKACSLDQAELQAWCGEETGAAPGTCTVCDPLSELTAAADERRHLTRGERDILDYVLDVALIHLEPDATHYRLTVADLSHCLRKTPGQLAAALDHLIASGMLADPRINGQRSTFSPRQAILPTAQALCTLPAFATMSMVEVAAEIARLSSD